MKSSRILLITLLGIGLIGGFATRGQDVSDVECQVILIWDSVEIDPESNEDLQWDIDMTFEASERQFGEDSVVINRKDLKLRTIDSDWRFPRPYVLFIGTLTNPGPSLSLSLEIDVEEWDEVTRDSGSASFGVGPYCDDSEGTPEERTRVWRHSIDVEVPVNNPENETPTTWTFNFTSITNPKP